MRTFLRNNRGFTLLELMMTVALLGIFLSILYNFLNFNLSFLNQNNRQQDNSLQARIAMFRITNELQRHQELSLAGSVIKDAITGNNIIDFGGNADNYVYYFDDTNNRLVNGSGGIVADNIIIEPPVLDDRGSLMKLTVRPASANPNDPSLTISTILRVNRNP